MSAPISVQLIKQLNKTAAAVKEKRKKKER